MYRALDYGQARQRCNNASEMPGVSTDIREFAQLFGEIYSERHRAEYHPRMRLSREYVLKSVAEAEAGLVQFEATALPHRRAFAAHVLFRARRD